MDLRLTIVYSKISVSIKAKKSWRYSIVILSRNILEAPQEKLRKSLRKLRGASCLWTRHTLCGSPTKPNVGKETVEVLMANMNNNANRNIKNPIMIIAGHKEQMNDLITNKDESRLDETCENSCQFCRFYCRYPKM